MPPRRLIALSITIIVILALVGPTMAGDPAVSPQPPLVGAFALDEILVGLNPEAAPPTSTALQSAAAIFQTSGLEPLARRYGVRSIEPLFPGLSGRDLAAQTYGLNRIYKVTVTQGVDIIEMVREFDRHPAVEFAELNRIYRALWTPNDPSFKEQWGLHNTGQSSGRSDADIDTPEAWDYTLGSSNVTIAIVDTGVDYNHPDLEGGRVRTDIDEDFVNGDDDAMDDHGHGTYCAGIAAATTNNGKGMAGVCPNCRILPVKVLDSEGSGTSDQVAQGIQYAADAGARIISMSLGFPSDCGCSETVARTINYAFEKGSLLIAASGNDSDKERSSYPSSSPRVMAVGASDRWDKEAGFSNFDTALDIFAPGVDIYSLDRGGGYRTEDGTSAATPFVAGAAGLLLSYRPHLSNVQLWWQLKQTADPFPASGSVSAPAPLVARPSAPLASHRVYLPILERFQDTRGRLNIASALRANWGGQMSAPVDGCTGEPACEPGCAAEISLAGSASGFDDLQLLRQFRAHVLASGASGRNWVEMYERNTLELVLLLARDAELRSEARAALNLWLPLVDAIISDNNAATATIRPEHAAALQAFVARLHNRASPAFRQDLLVSARAADLTSDYVSRDVREWYAAAIKIH